MKELTIKGKVFHFTPFKEWGGRWDVSYELDIESATAELEENQSFDYGKIRYYGMGGLVAEEYATEEFGNFDLEEQLEAAKLGCDKIYEYIK